MYSHSRFLIFLIIQFLYITNFDITFCKSVSQNSKYPQFCQLAAKDEAVFQTFRSHPSYCEIVETLHSFEYGIFFLHEINAKYPHLLPYFKKICLEDIVGGPISFYYEQIGKISPTVLRYVKIVGDLQREFGNLSNFNIVEIGGGFGGQCKIINDICGFANYAIIDLPECTPLINKYLLSFSITNFRTINNDALSEPYQYDLIISNYAISEIDRIEQLHYMTMILDLAPRGYIIYNHFPQVNPFPLDEFVALLQNNHKKIKVIAEDPGKMGDIIIWQP